MREVRLINENWLFVRDGNPEEKVNIPHCYNAKDGQDGSKMYRGVVTYAKTLAFSAEELEKNIYLEVGAAEMCSRVRVNGKQCFETECGFSLYRVHLSPELHAGENLLEIEVSNEVNNSIYPAMADFSFYGGLYRDVKLIFDENLHFAETDGSIDGVALDTTVAGTDGAVAAHVHVCAERGAGSGFAYECSVFNPESGTEVACEKRTSRDLQFDISVSVPDVHLWDGVDDPFLYDVKLSLFDENGELADQRIIPVGFRTLEYSEEKGLLLNNKPYKLRGVAKHQDFGGLGNAITEKQMQLDLKLILETGANSVRCSHYQHCDRWYELCDRAGLLVWAEIPVISSVPQKEEADKNAFWHLELLIAQVRNHCSVYCYGVQNEVCMISKNSYTFDLVDRLSKRCGELDPARWTAQANENGTEDDCPIFESTDVLGFNLYYGWYYGTIPELQERLDHIHQNNLHKPMILTEYGVDTNPRFHSLEPKANDYTEEYQLRFLENAIRAIEERTFMIGGYVWNMFDFGSAGRAEGGEKGKNQKGLVTIDRSLKKDAYYLYKAHWSKTPFVYIAGRRFANRDGETTDITVLSNCPEITLSINGKIVETKKADGAMTVFKGVALDNGENRVAAEASGQRDEIVLNKVDSPDPSYICPKESEGENAINWFEGLDPATMERVEEKPLRPEGFTFDNTIEEIFENPAAREIFMKYLSPLTESARFDEHAPIPVKRILEFTRALEIPKSLITACEQEINSIPK